MLKIYIRIWGGAGNQLFIYAFARWLSLNWKGKVWLETRSGFRGDGYQRTYKLNRFHIALPISGHLSSFFFSFNRKYPLLKRLFFPSSRLIVEDETQQISDATTFLPSPEWKERTSYYQGYWQHIHFSSIRDVLLSELRFDLPPNPVFETIKAKILESATAISVHVRRVRYSQLLAPDYYHAAISFFGNTCSSPCFFVFSDDLAWCRQHLTIPSPCVYVDNFEEELYELQLMSLCRHFIIANSSFSWWGAWLSQQPDKVVIMPEGYMADNMDGRVIQMPEKGCNGINYHLNVT